jgi:hypothetical protein
MKNEQIKQITNKAIEQLTAALNEGRSETLTAYLTAMAKFHRYSLRNIMLIAMQKPTATHVAGFHAFHRPGAILKKRGQESWTIACRSAGNSGSLKDVRSERPA